MNSGQYRLELYPKSHFEKLSRSFIGQNNAGESSEDDEDSAQEGSEK